MGMLISTKTMESLPAGLKLLIKIAEDEALPVWRCTGGWKRQPEQRPEEYGITIITPTGEELQVLKLSEKKYIHFC